MQGEFVGTSMHLFHFQYARGYVIMDFLESADAEAW